MRNILAVKPQRLKASDFPCWFFNHGFKFQDFKIDNNVKELIQAILLLSLLKMLIIVVLFITLTDLKQLIY